ncbi:hypothetical protein KW782_04835 [Candidatus Parcubacteria bacterium]|nr:hypothetical protein [Candidatus Parcubacteria bacterium]
MSKSNWEFYVFVVAIAAAAGVGCYFTQGTKTAVVIAIAGPVIAFVGGYILKKKPS